MLHSAIKHIQNGYYTLKTIIAPSDNTPFFQTLDLVYRSVSQVAKHFLELLFSAIGYEFFFEQIFELLLIGILDQF